LGPGDQFFWRSANFLLLGSSPPVSLSRGSTTFSLAIGEVHFLDKLFVADPAITINVGLTDDLIDVFKRMKLPSSVEH
jgi:hypothetical protein